MSPTAADETWTTVRYHQNSSIFQVLPQHPILVNIRAMMLNLCLFLLTVQWFASGHFCHICICQPLLTSHFPLKVLAFSLFPQLSFKHSVPHSASNSPCLQNIPEVWCNIHVLPLTSFLFRILFFPLIMGFLTSCRDFCRCLAVTSGSLSPHSGLHAVLLVRALQDTHS